MLITDYEPKCLERHMGAWAIEPCALKELQTGIESGVIKAAAANDIPSELDGVSDLMDGAIRVIPIMGTIHKGFSKFGGTSNVAIRKEVLNAANDDAVQVIVLHMDTPGGVVSGTDELARTIKAASDKKPVMVHADDLLASAGVWIATQATSIAASRMTEVGSIGTIAVLHDTSAAAESEGVKVHVITTAQLKATGVPGVELTDEMLDHTRQRIEGKNAVFMDAVSNGRGDRFNSSDFKTMQDGRVVPAQQAASIGLIDKVQDFNDTINDAMQFVIDKQKAGANRTNMAAAKLAGLRKVK